MNIDETLEKGILDITNSIEKIDRMNELSFKLVNTNIKQALELCEKAYELSKHYNYRIGTAYSLRNKGMCFYSQSDFKNASLFLYESLTIFREIGNETGESNAMSCIGSVFFKLGNYSNALSYHIKSLQLAKKIGNKKEQAESLNNIALIFVKMGEYGKALLYHLRSSKIDEEISNESGQAITKNNIGLIYKMLGNYIECLEYFFGSLDIARKTDNKQLQATVFNNVGKTYEELKDYENAIFHYSEGLEIAKSLGDKHLEATILQNISQLYVKKEDYALSIQYLENAFSLSKKINSNSLSNEIHKTFSEAYEKIGDYKRALEHHKIYNEYEKKILDEELRIKSRNMIIQLEIKKIRKLAMRYKKNNIKLNKANKNLKKQNKIKTILVKKLKKQAKILEKESNIDYLTKLYNRKYSEFRLSEELKRAVRYGTSLTFIMCDIDYFKKINDTFSHKIGDEVLKAIAQIFKKTCRSIDIIGRFGGDEFMLILPNTTISEGLVVCNRINNAINNYEWKQLHSELKVTLSFGLADTKDNINSEQLFEKADKKLYEAKNNGRGLIKI